MKNKDRLPKITDSERKMLDLLRKADAVFIYQDDGCRSFAWIRGLSEAPARVMVEYGQLDGKRMARRLKVNAEAHASARRVAEGR
jgi:hypothetical protein